MDIPNGPKDKFTLTLKPDAARHLNIEDTRDNTMSKGMMSLHHFRLAHRSGPNQTRARRIGFVIRFMSPDITQAVAESGSAVLVRGRNTTSHFTIKERFPMTWTM
jgi:ectoine hydroxylase-related dioxygenase (phytanoyl-CoA dioxygenase family)